MLMATLGDRGRSAALPKILLCIAVASAGLIAGRLSIERPSPQATAASRRDMTEPEKNIIVAALAKQLSGATLTTVNWAPLILTSREGITDYCGSVKQPKSNVAFYAQFRFPHADPHEKLDDVNFVIVAAPGDPETRYVVGTACLRYGYGALIPAAL